MKDDGGWHRDSKGNEHFYAHDAEWADREARFQKQSSGGSRSGSYWDSDRWHLMVMIPFVFIFFECYELWKDVEKEMKGSGFSPKVAEGLGIAAAIALLALAATLLVKAPNPISKIAVSIAFAAIAGHFIF